VYVFYYFSNFNINKLTKTHVRCPWLRTRPLSANTLVAFIVLLTATPTSAILYRVLSHSRSCIRAEFSRTTSLFPLSSMRRRSRSSCTRARTSAPRSQITGQSHSRPVLAATLHLYELLSANNNQNYPSALATTNNTKRYHI